MGGARHCRSALQARYGAVSMDQAELRRRLREQLDQRSASRRGWLSMEVTVHGIPIRGPGATRFQSLLVGFASITWAPYVPQGSRAESHM